MLTRENVPQAIEISSRRLLRLFCIDNIFFLPICLFFIYFLFTYCFFDCFFSTFFFFSKVGFVAKKEDLNGIQPLTPLTFSVLPAAMSWVFWQITTYMTGSGDIVLYDAFCIYIFIWFIVELCVSFSLELYVRSLPLSPSSR